MDQDPHLRISDNDKQETLACEEKAERVERGLKRSVLMPDIISIYFTHPPTVDLATALCGSMKLTKAATTHNALTDGNPYIFNEGGDSSHHQELRSLRNIHLFLSYDSNPKYVH